MKPPSSGHGLLQGEEVTIVGTHMVPIRAILKQLTVPYILVTAVPLCREVALVLRDLIDKASCPRQYKKKKNICGKAGIEFRFFWWPQGLKPTIL